MQLTEKHIIKKNNKNWKTIDIMSIYSKNLYNQANYLIKNNYKKTGKFLRYYDIEKHFRNLEYEKEEYDNYHKLPNNTSQQILMVLDKNYKSFFQLIKKWKKNKNSLENCPQPPKYKKKNGRNILIFTKNQFSIKEGFLCFPKKMNMIPLKLKSANDIQQIRIIPQSNNYIIEIIYNFKEVDYELNNQNYLSIDLGVNNLIASMNNQSGLRPLLINGKPVKSMNQYYNKKQSIIKSQLKKNHNKDWSNKLDKLTFKRKMKINYYFHNVSKYIVQYCIDNDIGNIIIGHNKEWKQNCNIGKKNNQNFVQIPFNILIQQIQYKAKMVGINIIEQEESYTSKVDHLAFEEMKHQENYLGKRIKRGLFQSSTRQSLNADVNGAIGILRKVIGNDFINQLNRGCVVQPLKVIPL